MTRHILIRSKSGDGPRLVPEARVGQEDLLHTAVEENPELIPAADFELGELLVVDREAAIGSGYVDLVCVDASGQVVIVEFKKGPETPDSRKVVAQVLEYGAHFWGMDAEEFERRAIAYFRSGKCKKRELESADSLQEALGLDEGYGTPAEEGGPEEGQFDFSAALQQNLSSGSLIYLIVSSRVDASLRRVMEYLNATSRFRVGAVEIDYFAEKDHDILVPRAITWGKPPPPTDVPTNRDRFLTEVGAQRREFFADLLEKLTEAGMQAQWGSKACILKLHAAGKLLPFVEMYPPTCWWLRKDGVAEINVMLRPHRKHDPKLANEAYKVWVNRLRQLDCWREGPSGHHLSVRIGDVPAAGLCDAIVEAARAAAQHL